MAECLRKPWLEDYTSRLLKDVDQLRIPFIAERFLQVRKFHNFRHDKHHAEYAPHEPIYADVSDKFCELRCRFTHAVEKALLQNKNWRLTEIRGAVLGKVKGHLCIEKSSTAYDSNATLILEISSFAVQGDIGGAVFGHPTRYINLPIAKVLLNAHSVLQLLGSSRSIDEIHSQDGQSSDDSPDSVDAPDLSLQKELNTQMPRDKSLSSVGAVNTHKRKLDHGEKVGGVTLHNQSRKRKRIHTGWGDFRDLSYYDCQIPTSQWQILSTEKCWMPQGIYKFPIIKHTTRKSTSENKKRQQQTRLPQALFTALDEPGEELISSLSEAPGLDPTALALEDDAISWASSPASVRHVRNTFSRADLARIRSQKLCLDPPPASSPESPGGVRDARNELDIFIPPPLPYSAASAVRTASRVLADDVQQSSPMPILSPTQAITQANETPQAISTAPDGQQSINLNAPAVNLVQNAPYDASSVPSGTPVTGTARATTETKALLQSPCEIAERFSGAPRNMVLANTTPNLKYSDPVIRETDERRNLPSFQSSTKVVASRGSRSSRSESPDGFVPPRTPPSFKYRIKERLSSKTTTQPTPPSLECYQEHVVPPRTDNSVAKETPDALKSSMHEPTEKLSIHKPRRHARMSSIVKFDLKKLQHEDDGKDVLDLLRNDRMNFLRMRKPPEEPQAIAQVQQSSPIAAATEVHEAEACIHEASHPALPDVVISSSAQAVEATVSQPIYLSGEIIDWAQVVPLEFEVRIPRYSFKSMKTDAISGIDHPGTGHADKTSAARPLAKRDTQGDEHTSDSIDRAAATHERSLARNARQDRKLRDTRGHNKVHKQEILFHLDADTPMRKLSRELYPSDNSTRRYTVLQWQQRLELYSKGQG